MDLFPSPCDDLRRRLTGAVMARAARLPGVAADAAHAYLMQEIHALLANSAAAIDYLERLPEEARKAAAYEFFASFFTHYLPRKFLRRYVDGLGSPPPLMLSEKEMMDCNAYINVLRCAAFTEELKKLAMRKDARPIRQPMHLSCPAAALTNGTLGQFTVKMSGVLVYTDADNWTLSGRMSFYDVWDFDPKDFSTGGRSLQGELKTRFAHYTLPGEGFTVESVETEFRQSNADAIVVWKGGTPVATPDRIAAVDMALKNLE